MIQQKSGLLAMFRKFINWIEGKTIELGEPNGEGLMVRQ